MQVTLHDKRIVMQVTLHYEVVIRDDGEKRRLLAGVVVMMMLVTAIGGDSRGVDRSGEGGGMTMVVRWPSVGGRRWVVGSIPATAPEIMKSEEGG
nr:hypothetical protein [Tanacetum cinerariifolium]